MKMSQISWSMLLIVTFTFSYWGVSYGVELKRNTIKALSYCEMFLKKAVPLTPLQHAYAKDFFQNYSPKTSRAWAKGFTTEWLEIALDPSGGAEKIVLLQELGFSSRQGVVTAPSYFEFIDRYVQRLDRQLIPQNCRLLPAVVMVKGDRPDGQYIFVTPGLDPWPTEPGYRILRATEQFYIPFPKVLAAIRRGRFPLLDAPHDVMHFVSFSRNDYYALNLTVMASSLENKSNKSIEDRMVFTFEFLTMADPQKKEDLRKLLFFPGLKDGKQHHPMSEFLKYYQSISRETLLHHARVLSAHYAEYLIDYGAGVSRTNEKRRMRENLMSPIGSTPTRFITDNLLLLLRPYKVDAYGIAAATPAHWSHILQNLMTIYDLPEESILAAVNQFQSLSEYFKESNSAPALAPNFRERITHLLARHMARMEYFAWETSTENSVDQWVYDYLADAPNTDSPTGQLIYDVWGPQSALHGALLGR